MIFLENFSQGKNNSLYDKSKNQLEENEKSKILYNYASPKNAELLLNNRKKNSFLNHENIKANEILIISAIFFKKEVWIGRQIQ